ncbi:NUDIX domain-containing protein [Arthrobacter sp. B1805]|uniref:NUDIX hydrolase n=1 Tax=Arthrobacter sp. B1805 TaxID=2058892 RepID=UPI000CE4DCB0|nr:NUDIX domain-containing protein [Arthrobacter sp. B1805]
MYSSANVSERQVQPPSLAISTVIFALRPDAGSGRLEIWLPLVRRVRQPHLGKWALPGGPLGGRESLHDAAARNLRETTNLDPTYLEQLYAFGGLDRSATQRLVSIVYWALVRPDQADLAQESENVRWFRAAEAVGLAFDHDEIVAYALERLRGKIEYGSVAYHFLGERFTLAQLRGVYEAVLGRHLDPANFRRQLRSAKDISATDEVLQGGRNRPPRLYRYTGPDAGTPPREAPQASGSAEWPAPDAPP